MLIEAAELAKYVKEPATHFLVLDTRAETDYKAGHIPFATSVDVGAWSENFVSGMDDKAWEKRLAGVGISTDMHVIVYGDDSREYCRFWWLLRYAGVSDVKVLNGGWKAWQSAGGPVDNMNIKRIVKQAKLSAQPGRLATKDQVLEGLKDKRFQIIDARSDKEFCGETKTTNRSGAMPGAIHLEWTDLLDAKTQRFKTQEELAKLFKDAGIDLNKPMVTYCQSGGRASVIAFGLELMGAKDVRNYYKSWAEWGNAEDTPIETPKK